MELRSIAERELTRLEKDARLMRAIYPRWMLLKGNSLFLSGRQNAAMTTYNHVSILLFRNPTFYVISVFLH